MMYEYSFVRIFVKNTVQNGRQRECMELD